jgi:hypothetical protein
MRTDIENSLKLLVISYLKEIDSEVVASYDEIKHELLDIYIDEETQKISVSYRNRWTDIREELTITTFELIGHMFSKISIG